MSAAHAQILAGAGVGEVHGGTVSEAPNFAWLVTGGYWGTIPVGFEFEYAKYPDFFPASHTDPDHHVVGDVATVAARVIVGVPVGGSKGFGVRPYVSGGPALFALRASEPDGLFQVDDRDWGFDIGGGLIVFAGDHIGVRADLRYVRDDRTPVVTGVPHPDCCQPISFRTFSFRRTIAVFLVRF